MFLGSNDVHLFTIIESLADEWHIHQTEQSDVPSLNLVGTSHGLGGLPVECTLSKDRAKKTPISQEWFNVSQELGLSLGGRANDNNV